jgi:DNA-binding transcriptional MocR family regulator
MTWRLMKPVWKVDKLTPSQRLVLLALSYYTDRNGANAYPSQSTLTRMCCCSRSTVKRALAALIARELIIPTGKGRKGTIKYRISMNHVQAHHEPATRPPVDHNPGKEIPFKNPGKDYFNNDQEQAVQVDRFSTLDIRTGSGALMSHKFANRRR